MSPGDIVVVVIIIKIILMIIILLIIITIAIHETLLAKVTIYGDYRNWMLSTIPH